MGKRTRADEGDGKSIDRNGSTNRSLSELFILRDIYGVDVSRILRGHDL